MSEAQIAQSFADAIPAVVYIECNPQHGQIVREIVEISSSWNALQAGFRSRPCFVSIILGALFLLAIVRCAQVFGPPIWICRKVISNLETHDTDSSRDHHHFVLSDGITQAGLYAALSGADNTKWIFADPERSDVRPEEAYQVLLSSILPVLLLSIQQAPLPFTRCTVLEFAFPGDEGLAWWDGMSRLCQEIGIRGATVCRVNSGAGEMGI